jgi:phosphatidylglycerophosphatase A
MNLNWFFLTLFYSGHSPKAPGTVGTLVSLPIGLAVLILLGPQTLFLLTLFITLVAIKSINQYELHSGIHDNQKIVIDELVGMWFALSIAPGVMFTLADVSVLNNGIAFQIFLSFLFFRIYDIKKPSIIGRIDRNVNGGWGVMGDDIVAGFAAGISSALVWEAIKRFLN